MSFESFATHTVELVCEPPALPPYVEKGSEIKMTEAQETKDLEQLKELFQEHNLSQDELKTLQEYFLNFNIDQTSIEGQRLLDVGSGHGEFARAVRKMQLDTTVINLDDGAFVTDGMDVMGKAEQLPFASESFDQVLAHCSVPIMHFTSGGATEMGSLIEEMLRVVKIGGAVRVFPAFVGRPIVDETFKAKYDTLNQEMLAEIEHLHARFPTCVFKANTLLTERSNGGLYDTMITLEIMKGETEVRV